MNVLLDTHVVLWWQAGGDRLSTPALEAIGSADAVLVSPLTCWEITTLHRLGRVGLDRDPGRWIVDLMADDRIDVATLSPEAAAWAGTLPGTFGGDPIDRLLCATARDLRVPLVSKDERLHAAASSLGPDAVRIIW